MGQNYFFGCISFNLKVIWPNLVRSEILDLGTLDLETAVAQRECKIAFFIPILKLCHALPLKWRWMTLPLVQCAGNVRNLTRLLG